MKVMKRKSVTRWVIGLLGLVATTSLAQQPNVVLVLTDDQGFGDWSWNGKHPHLAGKTPEMEKLSNEGVFMTDFHTMPLCGPSRASLMTGNHAFYSRVWQGRHSMRADIPTIADVFKANGYTTGLYGKWHLGHGYPHGPEHRGFDDSIILGGGMFTTVEDYPSNNASTLSDLTLRHNGVMKQYSGYSTDLWFEKTIEFIEANQNNPFFVIVSTDAPHAPHVPPARYANEFPNDVFTQFDGTVADHGKLSGFFGQIMGIDDGLGALRQKLTDLNLDDNTILMFMSDNGSTGAGKIYNGPADEGFNFYGWKAQNQEGGHRVPFFAYWKGHIEGGRRNDELTHIYDVVPTLVDLCGLSEIPVNANWDGHSMADVLLGNSNLMPDQERVTYSSYATTYEPPGSGGVMMYKDLRQFGNGALFDLAVDPAQTSNILGSQRTAEQNAAAALMKSSLNDLIDSYKADVFPFFDPRIVGTDAEPVVRLTCSDWNVKAPGFWIDLPNIYGASGTQTRFGNFLIKPIEAGTYRISMFRWSPYENLGINTSKYPGQVPSIGATQARMVIKEAGIDQTVAINGDPVSVAFDVNLPRGMVEVDAKFLDGNGDDIVSAYFINIEKVADSGNLPPVAGVETYQSEANTTLSVSVPGVLANDSDAEGAAVSAILVQNTQNGTVSLNANGSFSYTPNQNFYGKDSFSYKVNDGQQDGNTVDVELTVVMAGTVTKQLIGHWKLDEISGNTAVDSSGNGNNASIFNIPTAIIKGEPGVIGTSFDFTYGPRLNLPSNASMDLTNKDFSMAAWVKVRTPTTSGLDFRAIFGGDIGFFIDANGFPRLNSPNQPGESTKILAANKSIPLGSWGHVVATYDASERTVRYYVNGVPAGVDDWPNDFAGKLTYIGRERGYYGFYDGWMDDVRLYSEILDASDAASLAIEGKAYINNPPISVPETYSTMEGVPLTVSPSGLLANDVDYDQEPIKAHLASFPMNGTVELNEDGSFVYTPNREFSGIDMFNYRAQDSKESANTVTVYINVIDDGNTSPLTTITAPTHGSYVITGNSVTFSGHATDAEDGTLTGSSLVWSSDIDGQLATGGSFTTQNLSQGSHGITLTATDSNGATHSKSVAVTIGPDPALIPSNLALNGTASQSSTLWGDPRFSADKGNDGNTNPTLTFDNNNSVMHTDTENQAWWQVDLGQSSTINEVKVYNRDYEQARVSNYYVFVSENAFTSSDPTVLAADSTVWNSFQSAIAGSPSTINVGASGRFVRLQLASNATAINMAELEVIGTINATGPVNTAPVFTADPIVLANATEAAAYTGSINGSATDADGDALTYAKTSGPAWLNVAADGVLSGTPAASDVGNNSWTVEVNDGNGETASATLEIAVDAAADVTAPAAPTGLTAQSEIGYIVLDWSDSSEADLAFYRLYRSQTQSGGYTAIASGMTASEFTDTTAPVGITHYYTVTAFDSSNNESAHSVAVSGETLDNPSAGGDTELSVDDFEAGWGNWLSGGIDAFLSSAQAQGNQSADIQDNSGVASSITLQNALDLSSYDSLKIKFSFYAFSMDNVNEDFWVLVSNDGGATWSNVKTYVLGTNFVNDVWNLNEEIVVTDAQVAMTANMLVRFQCDASGNKDDIFLDDIILTGVAGTVDPLDPSLVAWWEFNEDNASATANTVDGSTGTLGGDALLSQGRLYLVNSGWVDVPVAGIASALSTETTISLWAWGSSALPTSTAIIRANNSAGDRVLNIHLPWSNSRVYWDAPTGNRVFYTSSEAEFEGVWTHWTFTKDAVSGMMAIYVNGVKVNEETSGNTGLISGINSFVIGALDTAGNAPYKGTIADIKIYNRVLDDAEIADLATQPITELTY